MIIKIISIALTTVIVSNIIKQYRQDISLLINISGAVLIVLLSIEGINSIIEEMLDISSNLEISNNLIKPLFKVVGIGYITEFSAVIAEDAGNKSMSSKIIFGGKIALCTVALPVVINMLNAILSLLQ